MGFISDLFAAKNKFNVDPNQVRNVDFTQALQQSLNQPGQTAQQQANLADLLSKEVQGGGPNLAQTQLQAATDRANQQAASTMASQRAINPALAARQILQQQAQNNQAAANQSAQLRQQQQLGAQGQLGEVIGQERGQDIGMLGTVGQLNQGQNAQVLQGQAMNEQAQLANQQAQNNVTGGLLGGIGSVATKLLNEGGYLPMEDGGHVPGEPEVKEDSPKNDKVHALLSPGEIVVPRSAAQDPEKAMEFILALHEEKMPKSKEGYGKVLQAKRKLDKMKE